MAHEPGEIKLHDVDATPLGDRASWVYRLLFTLGIIGVLASLVAAFLTDDGMRRFGFAYVLAFAFVLSLGLGSLFFVIVMHLFRAGWVVVVRRPMETLAANLPLLAVLFLPILGYVWANNGQVYSWAQPMDVLEVKWEQQHSEAHHADAVPSTPSVAEHSPQVKAQEQKSGEAASPQGESHLPPPEVIQAKRAYLNIGFFTVRWILYFVIWSVIGYIYWRTSIAQDVSGDYRLTNKLQGLAPVAVILFALTLTFASFDLLMTLDPAWFSTMWGVYFFAGSAVSTVAALILILMTLQRVGYMKAVNVEHYHDLGKLLFVFVFFWGYIAFSQYMLIWYGNIPEETGWFLLHGVTTAKGAATGWTCVTIVLLVGHLLIPFVGLLSRHAKRSHLILGFWAAWMLVMHGVDLWWIVMPSFDAHHVTFGVIEAGLLVGLLAFFLGAGVYRGASYPLVPQQDPRLGESMAFENPY